jgi:hypothetical protein
MRRWTALGLCLAAAALIASPVSAQKLLADSQAGYFMYTHNFDANQDGMDVNGGGAYVYFIANSGLAGTPSLGDNIRKCWGQERTRGGQEGLGVGPHVSAWSFVILGNVTIVSGLQTVITIDDGIQGGWSDYCIAPFTVNQFFLTSGFLVGPINYGLPAGAWGIAFFTGVGAGAPIPLVPYFQLNNGLCLKSFILYELQHGYNATAANQQYLGLVSIDEIQYPNAGGIARGNGVFGHNEWGGIVNNGGVVSHTRYTDAPVPPFGGGNYGIFLFPGQSGAATCDGLESYLCVGFTEGVSAAGRSNGCPDGTGAVKIIYGAGGQDWVSCATSTAGGLTTNNLSLRDLDYEYGQYNSPGSVAYTPATHYWIEWTWYCSPVIKCGTAAGGTGTNMPYDGSNRRLDSGVAPDFWTNAFNNNAKAIANVKYSNRFTGDVTVPLNFILLFDGCEPAAASDPITIGKSELPRGPLLLLSLCHPKAVNIMIPGRIFYVIGTVWCGTRTNPSGVPGPGSRKLETTLMTCIPVH